MPYKVEKRSGARPWKIVKTTTGQVVGSSTTKKAAQASVRAMRNREETREVFLSEDGEIIDPHDHTLRAV